MGSGMAQVGALIVLTVVVLPCCFFTLLALLDRLERSLAPATGSPAAPATALAEASESDSVAAPRLDLHREPVGLDVTLPRAVAPAPAHPVVSPAGV